MPAPDMDRPITRTAQRTSVIMQEYFSQEVARLWERVQPLEREVRGTNGIPSMGEQMRVLKVQLQIQEERWKSLNARMWQLFSGVIIGVVVMAAGLVIKGNWGTSNTEARLQENVQRMEQQIKWLEQRLYKPMPGQSLPPPP